LVYAEVYLTGISAAMIVLLSVPRQVATIVASGSPLKGTLTRSEKRPLALAVPWPIVVPEAWLAVAKTVTLEFATHPLPVTVR
jgi:hypothetical protein